MRIIIVGLHNKKGLKPLDSTSRTGELIDLIENELPVNVERTNLFDVDYLPCHKDERQELSKEWFWTHLPCPDDVVVLLGREVQMNFRHDIKNIIKINHPGYIIRPWSKISKDEYVSCVVAKIKKYCN